MNHSSHGFQGHARGDLLTRHYNRAHDVQTRGGIQMSALERFFGLRSRRATVGTEIRVGVVTFLALSRMLFYAVRPGGE